MTYYHARATRTATPRRMQKNTQPRTQHTRHHQPPHTHARSHATDTRSQFQRTRHHHHRTLTHAATPPRMPNRAATVNHKPKHAASTAHSLQTSPRTRATNNHRTPTRATTPPRMRTRRKIARMSRVKANESISVIAAQLEFALYKHTSGIHLEEGALFGCAY